MLEGIHVLNQIEITTISDIGLVFFIIFFILMILTLCLNINIVSICAGVLSFLSFLCFCFVPNPKVSTGEYEYQVIIDDTVSLTEFYEQYEIIDHDGKIWTIKEKEK